MSTEITNIRKQHRREKKCTMNARKEICAIQSYKEIAYTERYSVHNDNIALRE